MHTSIVTDSSNHAILLKHLNVLYFQIICYRVLFTQINLKKLNIVCCYEVEENFYIKRVTKKLFVTMTSTIARKEHTKSHKENYKRVK